jgi:hypothetical protein
VWLVRLSYLRYALKLADNPVDLLERESKALRLSPRLVSLLQAYVRMRAANVQEQQLLA